MTGVTALEIDYPCSRLERGNRSVRPYFDILTVYSNSSDVSENRVQECPNGSDPRQPVADAAHRPKDRRLAREMDTAPVGYPGAIRESPAYCTVRGRSQDLFFKVR